MSTVYSGRNPRPVSTSFQNLHTSRSQSPQKRVVTQDPTPRSRSLSPVKKSPTTLGLSTHLSPEKDPFDNASSTTAMSREQLLLLSQTPLSNTLHLSRNDYAIPIPFKLQMPPKLVPPVSIHDTPTSPELSGNIMPRNLIFNGTSYEPMMYEGQFQHDSKPASPEKPPSTLSNNKKVARFAQVTSTLPPDQLSLIEEKSVAGGSRMSSSKVKRLPSLPDEAKNADKMLSTEKMGAKRHSFHSFDLLNKEQNRVLEEPGLGISRDESLNKPQPPPRTVSSPLMGNGFTFGHGLPYSQLHPQANMRNIESTEISRGVSAQNGFETPGRIGMESRNNLPLSVTFQHNMYMAPPELKIGKRSFSDESCVSSVSSFSSVGDVLNFNHAFMSSSNDKGEVRVTSDVLNYLETGKLSRPGSLKAPRARQITQNLNESQDIFSNASHSIKSPSPSNRVSNSGQMSGSIFKHQNESFVQKASEPAQKPSQHEIKESLPIKEGPTKPLVIQNKKVTNADKPEVIQKSPVSQVQSPSTEDNNGAGVGFNFPNDTSNATNDDKAKKRAQNQRAYRKSTSFSSHFSNGQIEIPELLETMSTTNNKTPVDNVEPLGVPSAAAVSHLKGLYGEGSFDSDSEGSFNSQFHALQAKQASKPQTIPASKSHNALPAGSHPLKNSHSRHRSMYNIDFDHNDFMNTSPAKARPMSMNFASNEIADMSKQLDSMVLQDEKKNQVAPAPKSAFKTPIKINSSKEVISPTENTQAETPQHSPPEEQLNIKVAEAPKKIRYPVDFKDKGSKPQNSYGKRPNYYHDLSPKKYQAIRDYNSPSKSDIASSYKSSRTGQYTDSTAPTDNDSVVIDLTKESYDICMINRKDSTTSYKSVIEKTRDGKQVEIVLVEEDDEVVNRSLERDDLSSIYSHYMTGWDDSFRQKDQFVSDPSSHHQMQLPTQKIRQTTRLGTLTEVPQFNLSELSKANLNHLDNETRKHSNGSMESEISGTSANSWMPSESNFQVKVTKPHSEKYKHSGDMLMKSKGAIREPPLSIDKLSVKQKVPKPAVVRHSNHFDYHTNGNYDFNSFMLQSKH